MKTFLEEKSLKTLRKKLKTFLENKCALVGYLIAYLDSPQEPIPTIYAGFASRSKDFPTPMRSTIEILELIVLITGLSSENKDL